MSCKKDCHCYLCRELDDFYFGYSDAMSSSTDNFILMRPISAEPRPLAQNRQSKEHQHCNGNFTVRLTQGSEVAQSGVKLWKSSELLWNINGQSVRIENSKLTGNDIVAGESWVAEVGEDLSEVMNGSSEGVQDHDAGTPQACGVSRNEVIITRSNVEQVWQGAYEGYAVVC